MVKSYLVFGFGYIFSSTSLAMALFLDLIRLMIWLGIGPWT